MVESTWYQNYENAYKCQQSFMKIELDQLSIQIQDNKWIQIDVIRRFSFVLTKLSILFLETMKQPQNMYSYIQYCLLTSTDQFGWSFCHIQSLGSSNRRLAIADQKEYQLYLGRQNKIGGRKAEKIIQREQRCLNNKKFEIQQFLKMLKLSPSSPIENYCDISQAESTDDECSRDSSSQKECKANLCKYKTQMCKNYSQMGHCPYRSKCQFAHGPQELLKTKPTKKQGYRTKKCKSFWQDGVCRYGSRCQFLHYEEGKDKERCVLQAVCQILGSCNVEGKSRLANILEKYRN